MSDTEEKTVAPVEEAKVEEKPEEVEKDEGPPLFKSSQFPQPKELEAYLKEKLANPYNKYCLDCKEKTTTHCLLWLGAYVCKDCAEVHKQTFGGQSQVYVKDVFNEHWDDFQLRSVAFGGNRPLYELMKEYEVDTHPVISKYRHASVTWYKKRHQAHMDSMLFDLEANPKPPKNMNERVEQLKSTLFKTAASAQENTSQYQEVIMEKGRMASQVVSEKALIAKVKGKEFGAKVMGMFGKKKAQNLDDQVKEEWEESKDA